MTETKTPLFKKLNFKNHSNILVLNAPESFETELEQIKNETIIVQDLMKITHIDFAIIFVSKQVEIEKSIKAIFSKLEADAILWYCYPKGSSKKYKCDFNRDTGWHSIGAYNLEPVKQVAIDEDWSALRFRKVDYIKKMTRSFAISEKGKQKVMF